MANGNKIFINYVDSGKNQKVSELILKYPDAFKTNNKKNMIEIIIKKDIISKMDNNTKITEF